MMHNLSFLERSRHIRRRWIAENLIVTAFLALVALDIKEIPIAGVFFSFLLAGLLVSMIERTARRDLEKILREMQRHKAKLLTEIEELEGRGDDKN